MMRNSSFVVTLSAGSVSSRKVWKDGRPFKVGHPVRWILEKTGTDVTVRLPDGSVVETFAGTDLERGIQLDLAENGNYQLQLQPVATLPPVFETHGDGAGAIRIYSFRGNQRQDRELGWVTSVHTLDGAYIGELEGKPIFKFEKTAGVAGDEYFLESRVDGLELETSLGEGFEFQAGEGLPLTLEEIQGAKLSLGTQRWAIDSITMPALGSVEAAPHGAGWLGGADAEDLRGPVKLAAVSVGIFTLAALIWPKAKETEQAPGAQPVQIVMATHRVHGFKTTTHKTKTAEKTPVKQASHQAARKPEKKLAKSTRTRQGDPGHRGGQKAPAVAPPIGGSAFAQASKKLLQSGMTELLRQSQFSAGTRTQAEARSIFGARSAGLRSDAPSSGKLATRGVKVTSFGGDGSQGGTGVGYGKGAGASVSGQGKALVAMDTGGSDVDEGLTKDQVGAVIHRHMSEIRYCYEAAQVRTPGVEGKLAVNFVIGPPGNVNKAGVTSSTLGDRKLDECVLRRLSGWKFPKPSNNVEVAVNYPFIFKTIGR